MLATSMANSEANAWLASLAWQLGKACFLTAIGLILGIDIGENEFLGRSLCEVIGPGHLSPSFLDEDAIRRMLEKLVVFNELPEQAFGTFVAYIGP